MPPPAPSPILLRRLIFSLFPALDSGLLGAFAYGSVAFPQHGRSAADSQLDLILIVLDPLRWHMDNIQRNPLHYNYLIHHSLKTFRTPFVLETVLSKCPGPQIYFNPFLTWYDPVKQQQVSIKYGVVGLHSVMRDLTFWSDLYIAGRLHKPVLWAPFRNHVADSQSELCDKFKIAQQNNLLAAVSYVLLSLPPDTEILKEPDLFHSIASISYDGDWRMLVGEDKYKVSRLVTGADRLFRFRQLYKLTFTHPTLRNLVRLIPATSDLDGPYCLCFSQPLDSTAVISRLLHNLPLRFCDEAVALGGISDNTLSSYDVLLRATVEQRRLWLRHCAARTVRRSSIKQTAFSVFTAGPARSFAYAKAKLRKMFASLGVLNWK